MNKPELMTKKDAARYLRCSERTIDRYRGLGILRASKPCGIVLFRQEDLDKCVGKAVEK